MKRKRGTCVVGVVTAPSGNSAVIFFIEMCSLEKLEKGPWKRHNNLTGY
jgi:hypothetical protein